MPDFVRTAWEKIDPMPSVIAMKANEIPGIGFGPEEVITHLPTRSARLKWAMVVETDQPAGLMVNAAVCVAAAFGALVPGLLARGGPDADGLLHPGLPWAGCSVLAASAQELARLRSRAAGSTDVLVVDMPRAAQSHRVYDDYLAELARTPTEGLELRALGLIGPRNRVDKLTKGLTLLG